MSVTRELFFFFLSSPRSEISRKGFGKSLGVESTMGSTLALMHWTSYAGFPVIMAIVSGLSHQALPLWELEGGGRIGLALLSQRSLMNYEDKLLLSK